MTSGGSDTEDGRDIEIKRKTSTQRDLISALRQQQISEYQKKLTKEERQRRYALRHGTSEDRRPGIQDVISRDNDGEESPRKKKRVSFELVELTEEQTPKREHSETSRMKTNPGHLEGRQCMKGGDENDDKIRHG